MLVGLLAFAGYAVFPASFAAGFAFITAVVVFLLNAISPDTLATAWARLVDTLVGGGLGLIAYAVWPTWSRTPARQALADLLAAQRAYLDAILAALITDGGPTRARCGRSSRRARLARTAPSRRWRARCRNPPRDGSTPRRARGCWPPCGG